ncbi:hypothetical protein OPV22_027240 [Ensete ventricosum]|uniref:BED-type domain-containing protein n=1 Tax=Ensete ventricosum TaxID=4639 RepID=A0AAV8Q4T0_ENSVE|nr:hypothetical protein OPV22_027240 [Ensete ventricosum]
MVDGDGDGERSVMLSISFVGSSVLIKIIEKAQINTIFQEQRIWYSEFYSSRMPRPLDIGWQYGTMIGNHRHHVQCNYCHRIMIGGITRFKKHLASKKGEIRGCEAAPKEVREVIRKHLASLKPRRPNKKRRKPADGNFVDPLSVNYNMELDASDPDARPKMLTFNEAETHSSRSADQQFEVGTREFVDVFACVQYKDEQDFDPSRVTDLGWVHGVMVNGDRQKIQCRYCHKIILGGGISRLKQHLAGERGNIAPCEQVPDDVKAQMQQHLGFKVLERLKKQKDFEVVEYSAQQGIEEYVGDVPNVISPRDGSHNTRGEDACETNSSRRKKIVTSYIPQASAIPQSALQFTSQENIDHADITVAKFMYEAGIPLSVANSFYFQRMADAIATVGLGYKMPSYHSLRGLVGLFDSVVQDVGSSNIVQFITDGSTCYKAAGLSEMDEVNKVMARAKKISQLVHNHAWVLDLLKDITKGRDIVLSSTTTFITDYLTFQNMFMLKESLQEMFTCNLWEQSELSKQTLGIDVKNIVLDSQFWQSCSRIINVINPLITVLNVADSGERASMGFIYDATEKAKKEIILAFDNRECDYSPYLDIVNHVQDELQSPLHAAAYYLNPAIYYDPEFSMTNIVQKGLLDCIETLEPDVAAQDNITRDKAFYEDAVGDFGRPMAVRGRESLSPATWWSMYGSDHPNLQRFAVRILSQTCSMTTSDRACNENAYLHSSKNRLEQGKLNGLKFVHYNLHYQQRQSVAAGIKANIRSRYDPISVDNHNAEEWIEDPGLTEGEGINLLDVAQLDTSVSTAERLCNRSDDNFGNNDETVNGSDKAVYSADSSN